MTEERRLRVYTELRVLDVLSRRSQSFSNGVFPEFRSSKQEMGKGTGPGPGPGPWLFSRRDPADQKIPLLDYLQQAKVI